tara:strand:- start:576 stop:1739 length:1164 start_codon:yes stop_codon:yes gene_type:complete
MITMAMFFYSPVFASDLQRGAEALEARELEKAIEILMPLANRGDSEAQFLLAEAINRNEGSEAEDALKWYLRAAQQDHPEAQGVVGLHYELGIVYETSTDKANSWYFAAAWGGDAMAQYKVGRLFETGSGRPQDFTKAVGWYRKSAKQGFAGAAYRLGYMLRRGYGEPENDEESAEWLQSAADNGDEAAMRELSEMYRTGEGVKVDHGRADQLVSAAREKEAQQAETEEAIASTRAILAENIAALAQDRYSLGMQALFSGFYDIAQREFESAAADGHPKAAYQVARLHLNGTGVTQDYQAAYQWFARGAKLGEPRSQWIVSEMLLLGTGTESDITHAHMWANVSAANGISHGAETRGKAEQYMTKQQIMEAQMLARICIESSYQVCG